MRILFIVAGIIVLVLAYADMSRKPVRPIHATLHATE